MGVARYGQPPGKSLNQRNPFPPEMMGERGFSFNAFYHGKGKGRFRSCPCHGCDHSDRELQALPHLLLLWGEWHRGQRLVFGDVKQEMIFLLA